ncbi:hypothetical protein D3C74_464490 [compost metagenome]
MQCRFVEWSGANTLDLTAHRQLASNANVVVRSVAGRHGNLAPLQILRQQMRVDNVDATRDELGLGNLRDFHDVGLET